MSRIIKTTFIFFKTLVIKSHPHLLFGWLRNASLLFSNTISLSKWISQQDKRSIYYHSSLYKRDYSKRYSLYNYIVENQELNKQPFDFLEFGVSQAHSFKWWIGNCKNENNKFYGFDTFEGLPEKWGAFSQGDMKANIPQVDDSRAVFYKGLFQETLPYFIMSTDLNSGKRKIIHMDADLFTSTIFVLTSIAPYLKKGDIIIFDEFNVPNHEYLAYKIFTESFYLKMRLIGAVNNFFQVAFIVD